MIGRHYWCFVTVGLTNVDHATPPCDGVLPKPSSQHDHWRLVQQRGSLACIMPNRKAMIISIGNELVSGQTVDTNAAWIADRLRILGLVVDRHITVGDDVHEITSAISEAIDHAAVVIVTGGLGPTPDDLTREGISSALSAPLETHEQALAQLEAFFSRLGRSMPESNRRQALIPSGCDFIANDCGTAPGIVYFGQKTQLFALPGVPHEMKAMFDSEVETLIKILGDCSTVLVGRLQTFGMSEATIGEMLADLMAQDRNPRVGTSAQSGVIGIRIEATADEQVAAHALLQSDITEIRDRLGKAVFGDDAKSLEHVVATLLRSRSATIATAESCTGGLLAKYLTDVPGSSTYFSRGYIVYSGQAKVELLGVPLAVIEEHGSVSEEVAKAMALGCLTVSRADYAIGITGVAGPDGGTADKPVGLVYLAMADEKQVVVKKLLLGDHLTRSQIRDRSCKHAMNMLRLRLMATSDEGCD